MWKGVWVAEAWAGAGARVGTPSKQSLIDLGNGHTGTPPPHYFCKMIETRGSNCMFQLKLHIIINILMDLPATFTADAFFMRRSKQGI